MSQVANAPTPENQPIPPPPGADVEGGGANRPASVFRGLSGVQQWKKEDWMKKGTIALRGLTLLFSFLAFIVVVTINGFNKFEALNYLLSIAIFVMVYAGAQTGIKIHELMTGNSVIPPEAAAWIDFFADQIFALLLLSSASAAAAAAVESRARRSGEWSDQAVDQASASIAMSFFAFFSLLPAALISGYFLSSQLSK